MIGSERLGGVITVDFGVMILAAGGFSCVYRSGKLKKHETKTRVIAARSRVRDGKARTPRGHVNQRQGTRRCLTDFIVASAARIPSRRVCTDTGANP
jgi:hypothetical protein